jgi:hypothetical protein
MCDSITDKAFGCIHGYKKRSDIRQTGNCFVIVSVLTVECRQTHKYLMSRGCSGTELNWLGLGCNGDLHKRDRKEPGPQVGR